MGRPCEGLETKLGFADGTNAQLHTHRVSEGATAAGAAASEAPKLLHGLQGLQSSEHEGLLNALDGAAKLPQGSSAVLLQLAAELAVERNPEAGAATSLERDFPSVTLKAEHGALKAIAHSSLEHGSEAVQGQGVVVALLSGWSFVLQLGFVLSGQEQQPVGLFGAQAPFCSLLEQAEDEFVALQAMVAQEVGCFSLGGEGGLKLDGFAVLAGDGEHGWESEGQGRLRPGPNYGGNAGSLSSLSEEALGVLFQVPDGSSVADSG